MAQFFTIHPADPQQRLIRQAAQFVREGAVLAYPTDSCYALGCRIGDKDALARIRAIRHLDERQLLALICRDLSEVAIYARVNDRQFRVLKAATPGSYTFILQATREVPKRLQHPNRRTIGVRVPQNMIVQALLQELGEPLVSSTLIMPGEDEPLTDPQEIRERLEKLVDLVIDGGPGGVVPTTLVQLTGDTPEITRLGKGPTTVFAG
ncbi:MAG TPA: L-threonylcarbamoyladenylate synthase [Burkholderiales bacterium]|nr:L-threonylcarbamoyladenylate synthase [Burkholderiales bacterium]